MSTLSQNELQVIYLEAAQLGTSSEVVWFISVSFTYY